MFSLHETFQWCALRTSCSQDEFLVPCPFMYLFHIWGVSIDLIEWELHLWDAPQQKTWFCAPEPLLMSGFRAEKCSYLLSLKQREVTLSTMTTLLWFAHLLHAVLLVAVEIRDSHRDLSQPCSALTGLHSKGFCNRRKHTRNNCK